MRNTALEKEILNCTDNKFNDLALKIFHHQAAHCRIYREWLYHNRITPGDIHDVSDIPYLPVSFFKTHEVRNFPAEPSETVFLSSSTTNTGQSRHFVPHTDWYESVFLSIFEQFYGAPAQWRILALLPSYLEREGSSLIYMMDQLIRRAAPGSGFFNTNLDLLKSALDTPFDGKTLLFGVTYALLDLAESGPYHIPDNTIVMDTGGMKGRRREMVREEIHGILTERFQVPAIHSEYGMTELMSQAYSQGQGMYRSPRWMRINIADAADPGQMLPTGRTGRVCVMDLANLYSCAFIATDDLGKTQPGGVFEIAGRMDFSDVRGCNLLWTA